MTDDEILQTVLRLLGRIAPEVDWSSVRPDRSVRDQVDLDSMDFLNFVIAVSKELGVNVPEKDYPQFATLDGCVAYLAARLAGTGNGS